VSHQKGDRLMRYGAIAASRRTSTTARFFSDPGAGNFYLGLSSPSRSPIATHETEMGAPIAMLRCFGTGNTPPWTAADTTIAGGRIPWISWKEGAFTNSDIAAGLHDDWIDGIAAQMAARAPWPIWWTYHHEPENDAVTQGAVNTAAYRAAQRRMAQRIKAAGVTNSVFAAVLFMCPFTFTPASGRDWRTWYPDWRNATGLGTGQNPDPNDFYLQGDPNSVVDVFGIDFYHNFNIQDGPTLDPMTKWNNIVGSTTWSTHLQPKTSFLNKPYGIGEWATSAAQDGLVFDPNGDGSFTLVEYNAQVAAGTVNYYPAQTDQWIDANFANKDNGFVAYCYWDDSATKTTAEVSWNALGICDPAKERWKRIGIWGSSSSAKVWTG
jgi:hypothetical protein